MGRLNKRQQAEITINNFGGGYAGAKAIGNLQLNEAQDLDNEVVLPSGSGLRNRNGNDEHILVDDIAENHTEEVIGLHPFFQGETKWLLRLNTGTTTANEVESMIAPLNDPSAAVRNTEYATASYTFDQDSTFMLANFEDNAIGATGDDYRPLLFVSLPSGTMSLGAGTSPQAKVVTVWNNRMWAGNTSAEPSKLQYSILLSGGETLSAQTNWTDSGSGFVEPEQGDDDELITVSPISNNILLFFKRRTIYQVVGRSDPFAVFRLFDGVGCVGRHAVVNVDGIVYFITPDKRMLITDGSKVFTSTDIPKLADADDLWSDVDDDRLKFTIGTRRKGRDYDWIIWIVTSSGESAHDRAIIWDLQNKCWLQATTGHNANATCVYPNSDTYIGTIVNAGLYRLDGASKYDDDSAGTPQFDGSNFRIPITGAVAVAWKWRSDDYSLSLKNVSQVNEVNILSLYSGNGNLDLNYRYDGQADSTDITKAVVPSTLNHTTQVYRPLGRGDTFGFELNNNSKVSSQISKVSIVGNQKGSKDPGVV